MMRGPAGYSAVEDAGRKAEEAWNSVQQEAGKAWDTVKQEAGELWEGVKIGAAQLGNSLMDTAISLYEDPLGTGKEMLYNATIGTVEDIWNTGIWAGRMLFSDEYREKIAEDVKAEVDSAGGWSNYLGQQSAMILGGAILNRAGIRGRGLLNKKHDDLGGGNGSSSGGGNGESDGDGKKSGDEGKGKFNDPIITKTNKGVEVEFENPYGSKIKWVEQNPKNIPNAIKSAMNSSNIGKAIEGKVGNYVQQRVEVTGFGLKLDNISTGKPAGDIDVMTHKQIIEIKKSMSAVKMDQIDKYVNPSNSQFSNYEGREIVLYIDETIGSSSTQTVKMIQELNSKGVKVVNSLEELGGVLK
ncbi:hypothetical protein M4D81_05560 [Paenibacillus sp. p3-SID867]|uniref:hypothetical protein n=1 Tax=Paenibacillus sp. p3-SID867 TaxID=2916363 RepID=UPI0021A557A8|nr:hypothetical protein [Paenibacillus sp. p3-SID867]MCT1398470.1 hypothetical protein [Paenibacillus sp. p3-SID867]